MALNLSGRSFLTLLDFTTEEIEYMLELSRDFKNLKRMGAPHRYLEGKNIVLLFEKTSTRTRCAFEVGGMDLGLGVTYLDPGSSQMGKKESIEDTARVLGRMYDGIEYRGSDQSIVEELADKAGVPVWNGLTNEYHPTQALADILTMREEFGDTRGLKLTYLGKEQGNVSDSLMVICAKLGINFCSCGPKGDVEGATHFDPELLETCQKIAEENGCTIQLTDNIPVKLPPFTFIVPSPSTTTAAPKLPPSTVSVPLVTVTSSPNAAVFFTTAVPPSSTYRY